MKIERIIIYYLLIINNNKHMSTCGLCYNEINEKDIYDLFNQVNDDEIYNSYIDFECETFNCNSLICNECILKLQNQIDKNKPLKCPFCRQIQYKNYFTKTVLNEDLYLWKEKQIEKIGFELTCNEELINLHINVTDTINTHLKDFKDYPDEIKALNKSLDETKEEIEIVKYNVNNLIEKLEIYNTIDS